MTITTIEAPTIDIEQAYANLFEDSSYVRPTELHYDEKLSQHYDAVIYLLSELSQITGAYKFRGAFNWFTHNQSSNYSEVVAFSAGNHAAAVATCANLFDVKAKIFMPEQTPRYKVDLVRQLGGAGVTTILTGDSVDTAAQAGKKYLAATSENTGFIHPFDDPYVIAGQGTLGKELLQLVPQADIVVAPVGGGGLLSGLIQATRQQQRLHYVGAEPEKAASLAHNLRHPDTQLESIDCYVDGAAVKRVGRTVLQTLQTMTGQYNIVHPTNHSLRECLTNFWHDNRGLKPELAGGLSVAALSNIQGLIRHKTVVCVLSGSNLGQERFEREVRLW